MEPSPPLPPQQPPPPPTTKLRLMCSYGGQILPRPDSTALFYAGGDTRIIGIPTTSHLSLSSLTRHVSDALHVITPFTLKYLLPNHTFDYLISLSSDEDIANMLDEHRFLHPAPARIRLFLFHPKPPVPGSLAYPKRESWFVDALKSVKIGGDNGHCGGGLDGVGGSGGAESMVLETSSSFGSTSSCASLSSSGVKGGGQVAEDNGIVSSLLDVKVNVSGNEAVVR